MVLREDGKEEFLTKGERKVYDCSEWIGHGKGEIPACCFIPDNLVANIPQSQNRNNFVRDVCFFRCA
jgi:hypothetical protein